MTTGLLSAPARATSLPERADWRRRLLRPAPVHLAVLAVGLVALLALSTKLGFYFDDWAFLVPNGPSIWAPHVGHWSTTPMLVFRGLRDVFGLEHFLPFALLNIAAHLTLAHLLWRIMRRIGVNAWIATAFTPVLVFLGAGAENILWAFQIGFIGAIDLGLIVLLLLMSTRFRWHTGVLVVVLSVWALTFSGTSLPALFAAALVGFAFRGFWRTVGLLAPAGVAFLIWYALSGRKAPSPWRPTGAYDLAVHVPQYAYSLIFDGFGRLFPVAAFGSVLLFLAFVAAVISLPRLRREHVPAYALLAGVVVFAMLTAYTRAGDGIASATDGRYTYYVVAFALPFIALGISLLTVRSSVSLLGVSIAIACLVIPNISTLGTGLATRGQAIRTATDSMNAAMTIISAAPAQFPDQDVPDPMWAPDVNVGDLKTMMQRGWLSPGPSSAVAKLGVYLHLAVSATALPATTAATGCAAVPPGSTFVAVPDGGGDIHAPSGTAVQLRATDGTNVTSVSNVKVADGWTRISESFPGTLQLSSETAGVEVCAR